MCQRSSSYEYPCSSSLIESGHRKSISVYSNNVKEIEYAWQTNNHHFTSLAKGSIKTIPVVFYVIEDPSLPNPSPQNPNDSQINDGVEWINSVLAGASACQGDSPFEGIDIRLCLATRDINGSPTNGVIRIQNTLTNMDLCQDELSLKSLPRTNFDFFPNTDYLNIYLVKEICASCEPFDCLAGGFAAYPAAHGTIYDGIVLEAATWLNSNCDIRKVIIHELGHYFNLRHTWEGGCLNDNCLKDGDKVCDTPPDNDQNFFPNNPCFSGFSTNSCTSDVNHSDLNNPLLSDIPDFTNNFMDYAPLTCTNQFTIGQISRMQNALSGPRSSLLNSKGCLSPCPNPISWDINWPTQPIIYGDAIEIQNSSTGAESFNWSWFGGTNITDQFSIPADTIGSFLICVTGSNSDPGCTATQCKLIEIQCEAEIPSFNISSHQINKGDILTLTQEQIPNPELTYTWIVNGSPAGEGSPFDLLIDENGSFSVWLEACGNGCCLSSEKQFFQVGKCPTGKEANHWLFGRDSIHLDWNGGTPLESSPSSCGSDEPMAIAVNPNGQLLFYSNTDFVYNRNGQSMPNGNLFSRNTSTTHSTTVPVPGSDSLWYLFYPEQLNSSDENLDTLTKMYYAIIDMSLDNGLGDVVVKDQALLQPTTEKVTAVKHCNGNDWWIIGHEAGSNRFFAWQLTSNGLLAPIISSKGITKSKDRYTKAGEMNISNNGLKLALNTGPDYDLELTPQYTVELFDFDPSTGIISNPILIGNFPSENPGSSTYGLEFSPNSKLLYVSTIAFIDTIYQYNIASNDPFTIRNSKQYIYIESNPQESDVTAMLTGPDGKIYIANYSKDHLSSISFPDIEGIGCNFTNNAVVFNRGESFVGLPTFPANIYTPGKPWLQGPESVCDTLSEIKFYVSGNCRYQEYEWSILGSSQILRSSGDTVWIKPGNPGTDQLVVSKISGCSILPDTISFIINPCDTSTTECSIEFTIIEADTVICSGEDAWIRFNSTASAATITILPESQTLIIESSIIYLSDLTSNKEIRLDLQGVSCDTQILFNIRVNPPILEPTILRDSLVCFGENAELEVQTVPGYLVEIFPKDFSFIFSNPSWPLSVGPIVTDTTLYIRIQDTLLGCEEIIPWQVQIDEVNAIGFDTINVCFGDSVFANSLWIHHDTLLINEFSRVGCDSMQYTHIQFKDPLVPQILIGNPCKGFNGIIKIQSVTGISPLEYSLNSGAYQPENLFLNLTPGTYLLSIMDATGCHFDTTLTLVNDIGLSYISGKGYNATCNENNGSIILYPNANNIQFSIMGSAFMEDSIYTDLAPGVYQIIAINPLNCIDTFTFEIEQEGAPNIDSIYIQPEHCNKQDGLLEIHSVSGGNLPYSFQIQGSPLDTLTTFDGLSSGNYDGTVVDSNGCISAFNFTILTSDLPLINNLIIRPAFCNLPVGSIQINASGDPPLSFLLNDSLATNNSFTNLNPGTYNILVMDSFGCSDSTIAFVPDSFSFSLNSIQVQNSQCGSQNGSISINSSGSGIRTFIQELNEEFNGNTIANLSPGEYHLSISDSLYCTFDTIITIQSNCNIYLPNIFSPNGDGINDEFGKIVGIVTDFWELSIFNRSGNLVFYSTDPNIGWNGDQKNKKVQSGVYTWLLRYKLNTNPSEQSDIKQISGDVTVIR